MKPTFTIIIAFFHAFAILIFAPSAYADGTGPRLAAYYDLKLLICDDTAYQWRSAEQPKPVVRNIVQVGVGRDVSYGLNASGKLLTWNENAGETREILDQVIWFSTGRTGVFAARTDGNLVYLARPKSWFGEGKLVQPEQIATSSIAASVGDSADYFVTKDGTLHVKGLAHRGQYGDGKLEPSEEFIPVAKDVVTVKGHTGHAILLKEDGTVMGTGGNIYGPLGHHGLGDKAINWGPIFQNAKAIATGSSHSLALKADGSLWHWGRNIGLDPEKVLDQVVAAAADQQSSIALLSDNSLWQWQRGKNLKNIFNVLELKLNSLTLKKM